MALNFKKYMLTFAVAAACGLAAWAQLEQLPVKTINGKQYYYYKVQPKETVYGLTNRFGISSADLVKYNPSVADGLKADQELLFPVELVKGDIKPAATDLKPATAPVVATATHVVAKGETSYSLSRRYGMKLEDFYALNPSARDGLQEGQTVNVAATSASSPAAVPVAEAMKSTPAASPAASQPTAPAAAPVAAATSATAPTAGGTTYNVNPHDTFYSISRRFGVTVQQLRDANPNVNVLLAGSTIVIPETCAEETYAPEAIGAGSTAQQAADTMVIAVALPFNAGEANRPKAAASATEFYKGLLIAVDSLATYGSPIKVITFDTKGTADGARAILSEPSLAKANVIIAPDKADQLAMFGRYAAEHGIYLLNLYVVKDETYRTNPYMMHANIPHTSMYTKASDFFLSNFPGATPVVIRRKDGLHDKAEFVDLIKKRAAEQGREVLEVEYSGNLSSEQLSMLQEGTDYAFLPVSSKSDELQRILPAINTVKKDLAGKSNIALWGYPEWLVIRNDLLEKMHDADTYVFSRFYSVEKDPASSRLDSQFVRWYGMPMSEQVPRQGSYGFDVGAFLIRALQQNEGDFTRSTAPYDGLQNAFNFIRVPGGGWINDELFMLNYTPSGNVIKQGL